MLKKYCLGSANFVQLGTPNDDDRVTGVTSDPKHGL